MFTLRRTLHAAFHLSIHVCIDKQIQRMIVLQNHVGAAAHDHTVSLLRKLFQQLALGHCHTDGLVHHRDGHHGQAVTNGHRIGSFNTLLPYIGHIVGVQTVFLGNHLNDLVVIARDMQCFGQTFA